MGASGWHYFVPFQSDVDTALRSLKQQIFEQGKYYKRSHEKWRSMTEKEMTANLANMEDENLRKIMLNEWRKVKNLPEPTTIDALLEWNQESGTHSIIDMYRGSSESPEFGTISPLKSDELKQTFGGDMPNHETVLKWVEAGGYHKLRQTWQGLYVLVYDGAKPIEICFAGFSGD